MDRVTIEKRRLEYARVYIKIDVDKEIPRFINVMRKNRYIAEVEVIVPVMPVKCAECKVFGHSPRVCQGKKVNEAKPISKSVKSWKEKAGVVEKRMKWNLLLN